MTAGIARGRRWAARVDGQEVGASLYSASLQTTSVVLDRARARLAPAQADALPVLHDVTFDQVAERSGILPDLAASRPRETASK